MAQLVQATHEGCKGVQKLLSTTDMETCDFTIDVCVNTTFVLYNRLREWPFNTDGVGTFGQQLKKTITTLLRM